MLQITVSKDTIQGKGISEDSISGKWDFGKWDNWVCIKSRALGVKVDRRSQSQPAGLEQGAREVLVI